MARAKPKQTADFIVPINLNGMRGRMLRLPAKRGKKREILLVYPHHSSIERFMGLAEALNDFGGVTMPDIPGFGGMDSFYKVGIKPSLDSFADYLATFIKLRYRNRRFTIVGVSFGFVIITKMLQKYPEIVKKVDLTVSILGFTHRDELNISRSRRHARQITYGFLSRGLPSIFFRNVLLHPTPIRSFYNRKFPGNHEMHDFEVYLWRQNDIRTHMRASLARLTVNNLEKRVELPLHHVYAIQDKGLDNSLVEQHLHVIFGDVHTYPLKSKQAQLTAIPDKRGARVWLPADLKGALRQYP